MDGWMDNWVGRLMDGWVGGWAGERIDGCMMDGRMDKLVGDG